MVNVHIHQFKPGGAVVDAAALSQFQEQWATYRKLVEGDCLSHRAVGGILHDTLNQVFPAPFSFLDIACGDASMMKTTLRGTKVRHYHGLDLSQPALELAAGNLAGLPFAVDLDHRDFVQAMLRRPEHADAAWCSLSIHHLATDDKRKLMAAIHGATGGRGIFLLYEPTRRADEDRAGFLDRFQRINKPLWKVLTPAEWDQILAARHHLRLPGDRGGVVRARPPGRFRAGAGGVHGSDRLLPAVPLRRARRQGGERQERPGRNGRVCGSPSAIGITSWVRPVRSSHRAIKTFYSVSTYLAALHPRALLCPAPPPRYGAARWIRTRIGEDAMKIAAVVLGLTGFALSGNAVLAQAMNADDMKWINQCISDNKGGASDAIVRKYCICMNEKMDNNETRSITEWEKANPAARRACDRESGWR